MPRDSLRSATLKNLYSMLDSRVQLRAYRLMGGVDDEDEDHLDLLLQSQIAGVESKRYTFRNPYRKSTYQVLEEDLADKEETEIGFLNDDEFIQKYRLSKEAFQDILELIQDHPVFGVTDRSDNRGRRQTLVKYQLAVLLKVLGTEGSGGSNPELRNVFRNGRGTNYSFVKRVIKAIKDRLTEDFYSWPDEDERKDIEQGFSEKLFHHCVGIMDGTLFPLAYKPQTPDYPDYKGRKYLYSLTVLIICDNKRRIRYYYAGWPGSCHDNRVFRNSDMYKNPHKYFDETQYILCDSAYEADWFAIPSYKKLPNRELSRNQERFNTALGSARVTSEHCIGILKARFPFLKSIRKTIRGKKSLKEILSFLDTTILLHNFLLERNEAFPPHWSWKEDDITAVDCSAPEGYSLNTPVPGAANKETRRLQLTALINDHFI